MSNPTPCRYFLQGNCRFGDRCRFYHPRGGGQQQPQQPFYGGVQQQQGPRGFGQAPSDARYRINENVKAIDDMVKRDMVEWEKGKIWPFSCYGPIGDKGNLEGFEDVSPEELRYATLMNRGNVPTDFATRLQLWNRARAKWQQTTQANLSALEQLVLGTPATAAPSTASPFQQQMPMNSNNAFGSATAVTPFQSSPFGQPAAPAATPSVFGGGTPSASLGSFSFALGGAQPGPQVATSQMPTMQAPQGMAPAGAPPAFSFSAAMQQPGSVPQPFQPPGQAFGAVPATVPGQPFSQAMTPQQAFGQSPVGTTTPQQQPFGQSLQGTQTPQQQMFGQPGPQLPQPPGQSAQQSALSSFSFANPAPGGSPFGAGFAGGGETSSIFGASSVPGTLPSQPVSTAASAFGGSGSPFGSAVPPDSGYDKNLYTNITDLTAEEIKAFEAPQFDSSNLPLKAPAKQFCV